MSAAAETAWEFAALCGVLSVSAWLLVRLV